MQFLQEIFHTYKNAGALLDQMVGSFAQGIRNSPGKAKAQQLFGSAAGVAELGEALGVLYLEQGEWAKAANSFGSVKSNNAALAQILTKDYSKASQTLNAVAKPDATTSYLKAIVAARTNDANAVISNLKAAIAADKAMAKEAAIDLEFAKYATNSEFAALVK